MSYDPNTFKFYAENASEYAAKRTKPSKTLKTFIGLLPQRGRVLELGCGAGLEAHYLHGLGFDITATEGNPELAKFAIERLGDRAKVMQFDQLVEENSYDGIWANMCLLHAPWDQLNQIIRSIKVALKPGGSLMASFKSGDGAARDRLDRYYNLPTKDMLADKFKSSANWAELHITSGESGIGHDGTPYNVMWVRAIA